MADEVYRERPRTFEEINEELKAEEEAKKQALEDKVAALGQKGKGLFKTFTHMFASEGDEAVNSGIANKFADFVGGLSEGETAQLSGTFGKVAAALGVAGVGVTAAVTASNVKEAKSAETTSEATVNAGVSTDKNASKTYVPSEESMQKMDEHATEIYNNGGIIKRMSYTPEQTAAMSESELAVAANHGFVSASDGIADARLNGQKTMMPFIKKNLEPATQEIEMHNDGFFDANDISKLVPDMDKARSVLESSKIAEPAKAAEASLAENFISGVAKGLQAATGTPSVAPAANATKEMVAGAFEGANASRVAAAEAMKKQTVKEVSHEAGVDGPSFGGF